MWGHAQPLRVAGLDAPAPSGHAWISGLIKTAGALPALSAELQMQAHQPLRQRLCVVAHGMEGCGADADVAIPNMGSLKTRRGVGTAASDGDRNT